MESLLAVSARDPLQMLAAASAKGGQFEVRSVSVDDSGNLSVESPAPPSQYRFSFQGVTFTVRLSPGRDVFNFLMTGVIGHIPFTAEGRELRLSALAIIGAAEGLSKARFTIAHGQQVGLIASTTVESPSLPEAVLLETSLILHQVRPFIALMQGILRPASL